MKNLIGEKLDVAISQLKEKQMHYIIKNNNHSINGDTTLVTNVKLESNLVILYTGEFVFNVLSKPQLGD